jgi:hypothetical protein
VTRRIVEQEDCERIVAFDEVHRLAKGEEAISNNFPIPHKKRILVQSKGGIGHGSNQTYKKGQSPAFSTLHYSPVVLRMLLVSD